MTLNERLEIALDYSFYDEDSDATSFADYLRKLLSTLWNEGEDFSGERPFGNSGWDWNLYRYLVLSGAVDGKLDEYGGLDSFDKATADEIIFAMIDRLVIIRP